MTRLEQAAAVACSFTSLVEPFNADLLLAISRLANPSRHRPQWDTAISQFDLPPLIKVVVTIDENADASKRLIDNRCGRWPRRGDD